MKKNMKLQVVCILTFLTMSVSAKNYKGAEIYSNESYLYGRFEFSVQAATGSGQLSTFFLYRNNSEQNTTLWQEIDVEIFGKDSNSFQTNVIVEKTEGTRSMTEVKHITNFSLRTFHVFVVEWTPDSISWYVDDSLYRVEKTNALFCNEAMSIRFNHWAVNNTSWVGSFDKTVLPQYQYVEYIKYSSYTPGTGDNGSDFTYQWQDDFDTFNTSRWSKANWTFGENLCDFLPANAYTENGKLVLKLHDATPPLPSEITHTENMQDDIMVFPNPFSTNLQITITNNKIVYIEIYNSAGSIVIPKTKYSNANITELSAQLERQKNGMYIMQIFLDDNTIIRKRILKK